MGDTSLSLHGVFHAAKQHSMRGRFTSLMVLMGLLVGIVVMPAMAHAVGSRSAHGNEMLAVEEIEEVGHSQAADNALPCHAVGHHHCSMALQLDVPRVDLSRLAISLLWRPASTAPLRSHSQAPPLDPPNA